METIVILILAYIAIKFTLGTIKKCQICDVEFRRSSVLFLPEGLHKIYVKDRYYIVCSKCRSKLENRERKEKFDSFINENIDNSSVQTTSRNRRTIPKAVQREVWRRDEGKCVYCGSQRDLEYDHVIPVSKGGSNTARNIQLLCEKCNGEKSDKI
ncbi:HNH endonuclease [Candidatus Latescibacterota bacterium]